MQKKIVSTKKIKNNKGFMKKILVQSVIFFATMQIGSAQSLYDLGAVQVIEITFPFSNWDYQLDTAMSGSEGYIMATSCTINGEVFDSVGVKYKGNSSYSANNAKNPFHIDLEAFKDGQDYEGYSDIKLGNGFSDPSMVREALSYEILRNYMDAPLSNFAKVYVNGSYLGLFASSEHIGKRFAAEHFYSNHNTLFKCNPAFGFGGGPGGGMGASDLRYLGAAPSSYSNSYELKSEDPNGWYDLIHLCDTLNNHFDAIEKLLDIDRAIWMLAFNNVLVNLDSYSGSIRQNYYLHMDDNERFVPIVWDLNMSFGGFGGGMGGPGGGGGGSSATMALNSNSTSSNHPLIQKMWNNPQYRRMYIAHAKTIVEEMIANGWYYHRAQEMQDVIEEAVLEDNNKFFSSANFYSNLTTNVSGGAGGGSVPGLTALMDARSTYLNGTTEFSYTAPTISDITLSNNSPNVFEQIWVTANIQDATSAYLGYRAATPKAFTKLAMYDDGAHNDGAANDKVFGVQLPLESALTEYYIYAENNNAGKFSPVRAEHEFYTIQANVAALMEGEVVVNEFVASNATGMQDANGAHEDWIELFNSTDSPKSLKGLYLTNDPGEYDKWQLPDYAVIAANGYLAIWCDDDGGQSGLHANFKLSSNGSNIRLSYSQTDILEDIEFAEQTEDRSSARCPNGTGAFTNEIVPTYLEFNTCSTTASDETLENKPSIQVFPNPTSASITVSSDEKINSIEVLNFMGQAVERQRNLCDYSTSMDCTALPAGVYMMKVNGGVANKFLVNK